MNSTEWAVPTAEQLALWKTVDNPVENSNKNSGDAMSFLLKDKSLSSAREANTLACSVRLLSDLFAAASNAIDVLTARLDRLEHELDLHIERAMQAQQSFSDEPLSQDALVEKLRALRNQIGHYE